MVKNVEMGRLRNLWFTWVLASSFGLALGWPVYVAAGESMDAGYLAAAVGALAAGTLQSFVLRRRVAGATYWVGANLAAIAAVALLAYVVGVVDAGEGVAVLGTVLGVSQWLLLRRQLPKAGWWVLASSVGWVVGGLVSAIVSGVVAWALIGAVYGGISGAALVWLLRRPVPATL